MEAPQRKRITSIEQTLIAGQRAAIRRVDPTNPEEMSRLIQIEEDPTRIRWFSSNPSHYTPLQPDALREYVTNHQDHLVFAVSGAVGREDITKIGETGKLQGLIYVHPDTRERVEQLQALPPETKPPILEVSYAKLASGLRETCIALAKMQAAVDKTLEPNLMITAYIMTDERGTNEPSVRVLEASGFEEKGRVLYDEEARDKDRVFILNWQKLDRILKDQASPELPWANAVQK